MVARINGLEPQQAGWLTRLLYWFTRRSLRKLTGQDRLPEPVKIVAHHPALLRAVGRMEMAQGAARTVDRRLKHLAGLRASTLAGCPF
jgi:alkylhydroperoxidase family enzyme